MICIALFLLNLLQPVFVELLGLVALPIDDQSLYVSLVCLKLLTRVPACLASHFVLCYAQAKCALCFLGRLCFFSNTNNILDYGLLITKPTFLTDTSILIENQHASLAPVIEEDVEKTRGRKVSPFITMIVRVFGGNGSTEEALNLVIGLQVLLLIALLFFVFFLPINKEYLDNKLIWSRWLQKWVKTTNTNTKKSEKEKNSFFFKDSTFSRQRESISWCMLFLVLLLCFAVLYLIWHIRYKIK